MFLFISELVSIDVTAVLVMILLGRLTILFLVVSLTMLNPVF